MIIQVIAACDIGKPMSNSKILVVGLARNLESGIAKAVESLDKTFSQVFEISYFVVESDSSDSTERELSKLENQNPRFRYLSIGKLSDSFPDRVERIRYCRNTYVNFIRENYDQEKWDYVVVADLDGVNSKLNSKKISKILQFEKYWDVLTCNQTGPYYDIYALRAFGWVEYDCLLEVNRAHEVLIQRWKSTTNKGIFVRMKHNYQINQLRKSLIYSRMKFIPVWSKPIQVVSAFGGIAMYKPRVFLRYDYTQDSGALPECEHVTLHKKLTIENGRIFIFPSFTNGGWNEHSLNKIWLIRVYRRLKNRLK